jgi:phosphatidylethanolamine/phosphatidyl-N-methylethanolamine N-methyltransferase
LDKKRVERVYSNYAGIYDRLFGRVFRESREAAIRSLDIAPGERVLEVGVGTGLTLPLYPRHCEVVGIDLSRAMLDKARERVRRDGLGNVRLLHMDAADMAFGDDSFDRVVAAYVVTAVPDYAGLMREIVRVCRPQGRIVLLNHFVNGHRLVGAVERVISPLCEHIGFRTDLTVDRVLDGLPLSVDRHEKVKPLGMWHLVECVNRKDGTRRSD